MILFRLGEEKGQVRPKLGKVGSTLAGYPFRSNAELGAVQGAQWPEVRGMSHHGLYLNNTERRERWGSGIVRPGPVFHRGRGSQNGWGWVFPIILARQEP